MSDWGLITGSDGKSRCGWPGEDPLYVHYHDTEWGRPSADDRYIFEKICLEGFQAGLSWITILRKRENFRAAFDNFDVKKVARYDEKKVDQLVANPGIIRHRGKIESAINNASCAQDVIKEFGSLATYVWQFEPGEDERPNVFDGKTVKSLTQTTASKALSKDLKSRGWSFVGPTTIYAFMQSVGLVNDHLHGCVCREAAEKERRAFCRP